MTCLMHVILIYSVVTYVSIIMEATSFCVLSGNIHCNLFIVIPITVTCED